MKQPKFLQTTASKAKALAGVLVIGGGLIAARGSIDSARIHLKLADANEGPARLTMAPAARAAMRAVVKISASKVVKVPTGYSGPGEESDMFRQFFGGRGRGGFEAPRRIVKADSVRGLL